MTKESKKSRRPAAFNPNSGLEAGKVPPNDTNIEEAILSSCLTNQTCRTYCLEHVKHHMFHRMEHMGIFETIEMLNKAKKPVDILSVTNHLKVAERLDMVGGPYFVSQLTSKYSTISEMHIEEWCNILIHHYMKRELIRISAKIYHDAFQDSSDPLQMMHELSGAVNILDRELSHGDKHVRTWGEAVEESNERYKEVKEADGELVGLDTGFPQLNEITGGWQGDNLIILGGRPSMGKSALAEVLLMFPPMAGNEPVAFFSLEMNNTNVIQRGQAQYYSINYEYIQRGKVPESQEAELLTNMKFKDLPIQLDDTPNIDIHLLRNRATRWVREQGVKLIVIDYLQLITGIDPQNPNSNVNHQIGYYCKVLKGMSKELDVPVIVLAQLSRGVEERKKSIPRLSDLRDSGEIEQDADIIMFAYRPEYYKINKTDPIPSKNNAVFSTNGIAQILVQKNRNGKLGNCIEIFEGEKVKWRPASDQDFQERLMEGVVEDLIDAHAPPPPPLPGDDDRPF